MLEAQARIATQATAEQASDVSRYHRGQSIPVGIVTQHGGHDL